MSEWENLKCRSNWLNWTIRVVFYTPGYMKCLMVGSTVQILSGVFISSCTVSGVDIYHFYSRVSIYM